MKPVISLLFLTLFAWTSPSFGQLDLEQEVLVIPDTHDQKKYIWDVTKDPGDFELSMERKEGVGAGSEISFSIGPRMPGTAADMHVFVTDEDLHVYEHIRPDEVADGRYLFRFDVPVSGTYRFEIVFRTKKGWVNLGKELKMNADGEKKEKTSKPGDEEYVVKLKLVPKKAYVEHVTTFLYEIAYKGEPLRGLEKMDGLDMQLAAWDEDLKEFIYAVPRQNLGGPEVAVSLVFMRPGKHAVFAEFRHGGAVRRVESVLMVYEEPRYDPYAIENLRPSD